MKKILSISIFCIVFLFSGCFAGNLKGNIIVEEKLINPIIVDFVFIFDLPTMDEFKKIPSIQWFSKRNQYKMDFELTDKIQVLSYELVPGQKIKIEKFRPKHKNEGVIIYQSGGVQRWRLAPRGESNRLGDLVEGVNLGPDKVDAGVIRRQEDIVADFDLFADVEEPVVRQGLVIAGSVNRRCDGDGSVGIADAG